MGEIFRIFRFPQSITWPPPPHTHTSVYRLGMIYSRCSRIILLNTWQDGEILKTKIRYSWGHKKKDKKIEILLSHFWGRGCRVDISVAGCFLQGQVVSLSPNLAVAGIEPWCVLASREFNPLCYNRGYKRMLSMFKFLGRLIR